MMPSSRIPSPARSQGARSTPRRYKARASRSMGSPARSNTSVKLSTIVQMNSFVLSPMPARRSVLMDTTDIDLPRRKSWWKKLDENSREIMEVLNNKDPIEANNAIEEYIEVDVLSQEKKNYTMDIPESSDGESISSIVIPQRKLFTQKESKPQKKFAQIIDNREALPTLYKTQVDDDKTLNVGRKNLFNKKTKQRTKPLFPSALLNLSANKTIANKTKEIVTEAKAQVKNLFGNRPGVKRKNMFADFIVSDSEDEIPEIQPKVFGFQKKADQKRRQSLNTRGGPESRLTSPTSSITDIEIDDWRLLPSSTMVDHQLEAGLRTTPSKKARLSKLSEAIESINTGNNTSTNKTKQSNKSLHSKTKSKNVSHFKQMEIHELISPHSDILELDIDKEKNKSNTKNNEQSSRQQAFKNKEHSKSKNVSLMKTVNEAACEIYDDKNPETNRKHESNKKSKTLSKIDQVLQSDDDDDEDFTLVYENDDNDEAENSKARQLNLKATKFNSQNVLQASQIDNENTKNEQKDELHNSSNKHLRRSIPKTSINKKREISKLQNELEIEEILHVNQAIDKGTNRSQLNMVDNFVCEEIQDVLNNQGRDDGYEARHEHIRHNTDSIKEGDNDTNDIEHQKEQEVEKDPMSVDDRVDADEEVVEQEENAIEDEEQYNYEIISQEEEQSSEKEIEDEEIEGVEIQEHDDEKNEYDEIIDNQDDEEEKADNSEVEQDKTSEENKMEDEIEGYKHECIDHQQNEDNLQNKDRNVGMEQSKHVLDKVCTDIINSQNKDISYNQNNLDEEDRTKETQKNLRTNITHDVTTHHSQHRQKKDANIPSPEQILHDTQPLIESFAVHGRNTSVRKTKSIIKNLTIRPSMAPVRESTGFSNGSRNSSVEGSGWDSHRTTRATLRQTFGKDFTPRKSLRALVMEKSAKRQTNLIETNAEISRFPQANSTELPGFDPFTMDKSNVQQRMNKSNYDLSRNKSNDSRKLNKSHQLVSRRVDGANDAHAFNKSEDAHKMDESNHEVSKDTNEYKEAQEINEAAVDELNESVKEASRDIDELDDIQKVHDSAQEGACDTDDAEEVSGADNAEDMSDADDAEENSEAEAIEEMSGADYAEDMCDADDAEENSEAEAVEEMSGADNAKEISESDDKEEMNETENAEEMSEPDDAEEMDESNDFPEIDESGNTQEMNDSDDKQEVNESVDAQEINDSVDAQDINESVDEKEMNESDGEQEMNDSHDAQEMDQSEETHEMNGSDHEVSCNDGDTDMQQIDSNFEQPRKAQQSTLEMYLQKVKKQNIERKKQLEDEIRNSLKPPTRDMFNPFKVPAIPKLRRGKTQQIKSKAKSLKSSVIPLNILPVEVLEDMKYKPPKRYRPTNASWITKRLYKYLETKLEPKYDYKARVRSEKLVETIYNFTKDIRRHGTAPTDSVDALKHEMARLNVVKTHFEFYEFFHEYMPREVRVKVVPDVFNKISLPRYGVFSDILR